MNQIVNVIKNADMIDIVSHKDPDGDAIGSQLALGLALESIGKSVSYYNLGEIPEYLVFLPGSEKVKIYYNENLSDHLVIYVDCSDAARTGLPVFSEDTINIDHHISNDFFAKYNLVDSSAASTGEIIYKLLLQMGIALNKDISTNIYTAVSTDTGSFLFSNTTSETHLIAADLIKHGADIDALRENFYEGISFKRFKLIRYAYQEIKFSCDNRLAWVKIPLTLVAELGAKEEDTEGMAGHIRSIKDVEVALLLKEREDGKVKGSLRSKKVVDVSDVASRFSGGGHKRAAGFELKGTLDEVEKIVIAEIKKELENV